jgi:hypothetical protein
MRTGLLSVSKLWSRISSWNVVLYAIPILVSLLVVLTYSNTADDPDLWWHLKQGEIIYRTRALPVRDDFSYTTYIADRVENEINASSPLRQTDFWSRYNIKFAWLGELLFYLVYRASGISGMALFKSLVFSLTFLISYLTMKRRGGASLISLGMIGIIAANCAYFNYPRPQMFSFLFFSCMLAMLYSFRRGGKSLYALPFLMVLWVNLHGGFILGIIVLLAFAGAETVKHLLHLWLPGSNIQSLEWSNLKKLYVITFLSALASLASPTGYEAYRFPFVLMHSIFKTIDEYHPPHLGGHQVYWIMLALLIISVIISAVRRRLDLTDLSIVSIVAIASLNGLRFIPFFSIGAAPFLASTITSFGDSLWLKNVVTPIQVKMPRLFKVGRVLISGIIVTLLLAILIRDVVSGRVFRAGFKIRWPAEAVSFIKKNELTGNMFNQYEWGGYIIWALGPQYKTFIDGRCLNEAADRHYLQILSAYAGDDPVHPIWKRLLDIYDVQFILVSAVSHGEVIPLVASLYVDPEWELVFADGKSLIFIRNTSANHAVIEANRMSKEVITDETIAEIEAYLRQTPAAWPYYELLGYTYFKKWRFADALNALNIYLSKNPRNERVRDLRDTILNSMSTNSR